MHELFRVMTMPIGDLLDAWFETDALKGAIGSTGVVGVWAGPRTPGTAYNLLHHELGELNGIAGAWGHVKGGMGGISEALAAQREVARRRDPDRRAGPVDRRERRPGERGHARERRGARGRAGDLGRAPAHDRARHGRRRALPGRGGERHAQLPQPRRLGEDQLHPLGAAPLRCTAASSCCARASRSARRSTTWSAPGRTRSAASRPPARTSRSRSRAPWTPRSAMTAAA